MWGHLCGYMCVPYPHTPLARAGRFSFLAPSSISDAIAPPNPSTSPQSVDLSALLLYIHEFFDALGPEELRKRGAREDKPVRGKGDQYRRGG